MDLELYVYTTSIYKKEGLLKVGHAQRGTHKKRIKEQFNASNPEKPEILWVKDLPKRIKDHHIHKKMEEMGIKRKLNASGREWFKTNVEKVKEAFNAVVCGIPRSENFKLRSEQKEAVEKARNWFLKNHSKELIDSVTYKNRFILNAKMRFGKCFTGIHIAKSIQSKNTVIITYHPQVIEEWMHIINKHTDFNDFIGIRCKKGDDPNQIYLKENGKFSKKIKEKNKVYLISFQDLNIKNKPIKNRLNSLLDIKWDLLIFDEAHFGGLTTNSKKNIDALNPNFRLDLSGTPFRLIRYSDFCEEQIFTYNYSDEMNNKRKEEKQDPKQKKEFIYRKMPDLDISTMNITDEDIQDQISKFKTDDIDFSLNKLFKVKNGNFLHETAVDHFLENLTKRGHEARAMSIYGALGDKMNLPNKIHSIWWLSRVNTIRCLRKKIEKHPILSQYEVILATGGKFKKDQSDEKIIDDSIKSVKDIEAKIKKANDKNKAGTITLTCKKYLTGVTVKPWNTILILNDIESFETYYQAIFRTQSPYYEKNKVKKPKSFVFDFSLSRSFKLIGDLSESISDEKKSSFSKDRKIEITKKIIGDFNFKAFYEGKFEQNAVTPQQIFDATTSQDSKIALSKRITSNAIVGFESLAKIDDRILEILKRIKGYRSGDASGSVKDFQKIGVNKQKLKQSLLTNEEDLEKQNNKLIKKNRNYKWYATQMKRLSICMSDFIYMTEFREWKISDVIETKDPEFFEIVTGITKADFKILCDEEYIKKEILNEIVRRFRLQEDSSVKTEEFICNYIEENKKAS